jgi:transcriptional antiterminator NusG
MAARRKKTPAVEEGTSPQESPAQAPAVEEKRPGEQEPRADDDRRWYVIHTYSGYEDKVKANLEHRVQNMDVADLIFEVVVPCVDEIEIRDGQRRTVPRKIFPGYVLVQMIELKREDDPSVSSEERMRSSRAWYVVRNTPGVTGFVGSGQHPMPLEQTEVNSILRQMRAEEPRVKVGFTLGQSVRIVDGPFIDFIGTVDDINLEKGKVKVLVSFFGRETPVELDFLQVERL